MSASLPFTQGSKSAASPSAHRGRSSAARTTPGKSHSTPSQQAQQKPALDTASGFATAPAAVARDTQAAAASELHQRPLQPEQVGSEKAPRRSELATSVNAPSSAEVQADQQSEAVNRPAGTVAAEVRSDASKSSAETSSSMQPSDSEKLVQGLMDELLDAVTEHVQAAQVSAACERTPTSI